MPEFFVSTGLPSYPSGLSDKEAALVLPLYKAIATLTQQLSYVTGNVQYSNSEQGSINPFTKLISEREQKIFVKAGEALAFGNVITLTTSGGVIVAYKATSSDVTKPGHAIVDDPAGIALNEFGEAILLTGRTTGITGTTFGTVYYLGTAGQVQSARPQGPNILTQIIGYGLGTAGFYAAIEPAGTSVYGAYGAFVSTVDQVAGAINTPYAVTFNTTQISRGVSIGSPTSRVVVDRQGVYNIQFSLQLDKSAGGKGSAWIWPRINGTNVADSASQVTIKDPDSETVPAWNFLLPLNAGDYFELIWQTDDTTLRIEANAAAGNVPLVPSAILTVTAVL